MGWKVVLAILNLIAGIIVLSYPLYSTFFLLTFVIIIIGVWACITGIAHLYHAFSQKDAGNGILGIISLVFGILLLVFPLIWPHSCRLLPGSCHRHRNCRYRDLFCRKETGPGGTRPRNGQSLFLTHRPSFARYPAFSREHRRGS